MGMNGLTARHHAVIKYLETLSPKLNVYVKFLTSELRNWQERRGRKNSKKKKEREREREGMEATKNARSFQLT